jgi:hypothetical protein
MISFFGAGQHLHLPPLFYPPPELLAGFSSDSPCGFYYLMLALLFSMFDVI